MAKLSLYDFDDYKAYVSEWMKAAPHGTGSRLAEFASIHKTTLSQIFRGSKHLTLEQGAKVAEFIKFNPSETDFFLLLIELGRSGSHTLTEILKRQLGERRKARKLLGNRVTPTQELTEEQRAIYYSNWLYSAVKNLSAIREFGNVREIAKHFKVELHHIQKIVKTLVDAGICVEKNGRIEPGVQSTHLAADSPLVNRHHANWRMKAIERHPFLNSTEELAYTAPMTLSGKDAARIRRILVELVEKTDKIVTPSESERLFCMNLDWFEIL